MGTPASVQGCWHKSKLNLILKDELCGNEKRERKCLLTSQNNLCRSFSAQEEQQLTELSSHLCSMET